MWVFSIPLRTKQNWFENPSGFITLFDHIMIMILSFIGGFCWGGVFCCFFGGGGVQNHDQLFLNITSQFSQDGSLLQQPKLVTKVLFCYLEVSKLSNVFCCCRCVFAVCFLDDLFLVFIYFKYHCTSVKQFYVIQHSMFDFA